MENKGRISVLLLLMFFVGESMGSKNVIKLDKGAYSNLLIAIDRRVPEDLNIIENLKTMFTSASHRLYLASKQHVYWHHIKILVPNTWSLQNQYQFASTETYQSANIVVHDFADDNPFVDNFAGCGKEGSLMHMTPEYILNETHRENKFGPTDTVLVRSWGYYRWGLFKEHYDGKGGGAPFYDSPGGGTEGTRCSLKIEGSLEDKEGPCRRDNSGYHPNCRFVPDTAGQTATASLLFGTPDAHIHSIQEFCHDDPSEPDSFHNPLAPNVMNVKCGGRSAWTVMRENTTDFEDGSQLVFSTTPIFDVLQLSLVRSVVLVLDISGSMAGNRFDRMIQSCTDYIMNVIPRDSKLGIVSFESSAYIRANITNITETASRKGLVAALPTEAEGGTCIGCGIRVGIQVLGSYSRGGYLLLLSDGVENKHPYIEDTYKDIETSGVIIDTITISNSADEQMEDLSVNTTGISTFCSDSGTGTCLLQALQSTITQRPDVGLEMVPIQIYSSEVVIEPNPGFEVIPVVIDDALGNDTVISVILITDFWEAAVVVTGPDGTRVDHSDQRYHFDYNTKIVTVNLAQAQAGRWNVTISNMLEPSYRVTEYASVAVTSKPSTQEYTPITVTVLLGSRDVDFSQTPVLGIYAQVHQDYQPILNADVTAIISDANSTLNTTKLLDDGSGSDLFKDDGIYSWFFTNFTSNGRYNVKVNVLGFNEVIAVEEIFRGKRSAESEMQTSSEPSFMRTASGGVFKVQNYSPNASDILPPSRIQDLIYTSFSYDNSTVTLSWTAVGDDMDQGTANSYELRYSTDYYQVRNHFSNSHEVTQDELVNGNLSHVSPSGAIEAVTITLPEKGQDTVYYFAIRAWDEAGNGADLSNFVSLLMRFIPVTVPTTTKPSTMEPSTSTLEPTMEHVEGKKPTGPENWGLIIGLSCAAGTLIIGVIAGYIYYRKRSIAEVEPKSALTRPGYADIEAVQQSPIYENDTYPTN